MDKPNLLINEISPYLLQHAHNPVDWFPWGEEAFTKARSEDKPVFLSIGYSTCHWCHVMEKESFEDPEVAAALNAGFVCIKVDREERPDIDAVYMAVCHALNGSGGWPLTVFLTPGKTAFFAGTYFPKEPRYGQRGLLELLGMISRAWKEDKNGLLAAGKQIAALFSDEKAAGPHALSRAAAEEAENQLERRYDARWGGFDSAPKFPAAHNILFLLRCHLLGIGRKPLAMAEHALRAMYQGGIFDHIGGGFSRYSTDEKWLAPHFEKMLYDNALLAMAYTEAFQITANPLYRGIAEKIFAYARREMTSPEGGFYSAQDADSEGEEGKYYTVTPDEIRRVLGEKDGRAFCEGYDVTGPGNFEGKSIPNLIGRAAALPDDATEVMLEKLYAYRLARYPLHKDDKTLTAWTALMAAAYAKAYRVFGKETYLHAAENALSFIARHLTGEGGRLRVSFRNGRAKGDGLLDDYAFLAWACLELYESTFRLDCLERARDLMSRALEAFSSPSGGLYLSPRDGERLLFSPKEYYDGAMPSGNSVAAWCLARLAALTGEESWRTAAERQLAGFGEWFEDRPSAVTFALTALLQVVYPAQELVCVLADEKEKAPLALALGGFAHPQTAVLVKAAQDEEGIGRIAPFAAAYPVPRRGAVYYLCQNRRCDAPTGDFETVRRKLLGESGPAGS
ncbi:conserved hypothetical protein [uncultured delta proteobacterium]|uniref:Spermatogenesis-associated protein 20-like TRX domain-containing protein n=1 Tax=uncultured delta proteobacterium TaxID=34034 RepID=A0A212JIB0_9DELT|nr:conserved hypothetical protein [uncultured delta proteobacterium]